MVVTIQWLLQSRSQSMPVRGLVVGIALAKRTFPIRFRTVDACSLTTIIKSQSILNAGPQEILIMLHRNLHRNLLKSYTLARLRKLLIRKVFTKRIYLFDSVSMERLKSAAQSALTKRKLKHCVKERADGMPTGYGKSLIF